MRKPRSERQLRWELLHLAGLCAFALTEPIYRLIAGNPQILAAHAASRWHLALLVSVLSLLVPLLLAALELLALPFGARARAVVHGALVWLLASVFAAQVAMRVWPAQAPGWPILPLALASGAAFTIAYHRATVVYAFTSFLALLAVVSPLAFLLDQRTREFLRLAGAPAPAAVEVGNPAPLVVLVLDELPLAALLDDRLEIDAALFPSFARVAGMSHWYRDATSISNYTDIALPALHSGRYISPDRLLPATLANYPENLFTLLGATYQVHAMESTTDFSRALEQPGAAGRKTPRADPLLFLADVAAVGLHVVTPPPWNARLPRLDVGWAGFWQSRDEDREEAREKPDRIAEVRAFLAALEPGPRPPFVYLHRLLPHIPWEYLPSGRRYYGGARIPGLSATWSEDEWLTAIGYQRLRLQLQAVDGMVGALLDRLEELGWLDRSLLVVTSDHGCAFTPGAPRRDLEARHVEILRAEIMPIPLFVKLPGQHQRFVHDDAAEIVDVLPTIAGVLDVDLPWSTDGASLLDAPAPERPTRRIQLRSPFVTVFIEQPASSPLERLTKTRNRWFSPAPGGGVDLFRLGPDADLVGRPTAGVSATVAAQHAVIDDENLYLDVDPDDRRVPAFVTGEVLPHSGSPSLPSGSPVAIGVDGVVRATTRTYVDHAGAVAFAALLPEQAFHRGSHRVELFLVDRDGTGARLTRLEARGEQETLRQEWERSRDTLFRADAASGWQGFVGSMDTEVTGGRDRALEIRAAGMLPLVDLPAFDAAGAEAFVVAIETESDSELTPRLRYMTASEPVWGPKRFVQGHARQGRGTVFLEVREPGVLGRLRLDLGRTRSRVLLHSIEVRRTAP